MSPSPLISIIVPTYNRAHTLPRALDSLKVQSYENFEVLVINDGSKDNTEELVARYTRSDSRFSAFYQANQGVSVARNLGITHARGEWIAFLDSDDEWLPDKLHRQLLLLAREKTLWCHTEEIWIRNGVRVNQKKIHQKPAGRIFLSSLPLCVVSPSSVLIHRSVFEQTGVFDPLLPAAEDYDLWLRISCLYPISFLPQPLIIKHGGHPDQLSGTFLGLDRFRLRALAKHLKSPLITEEEQNATLELYLKKARILWHGYAKHGKAIPAQYYKELYHAHLPHS